MQRTSTGWSSPPAFTSGRQGQALIELTIVVPLMLLLVVIVVNFGGWLYAWTEVGNAARAVANYAVLGSVSVGLPSTPNTSAYSNMISTELTTLPSGSSATTFICWNKNGAISEQYPGGSGACTAATAPADPEGVLSVTVDITYSYNQFFSSFSFPSLGIKLLSLPTTIHRRVVMRFI